MTSKTRTCWIGSLKYSPILSGQEEHQGLADGVSFPLIKLFLVEELILLPGDEEGTELAAALMDPRDTAHPGFVFIISSQQMPLLSGNYES